MGWAKLMVTGPVTVSHTILRAQKRLHAVKSLTSLIMPALVVMANTTILSHSLVGFSRPPLANLYSRLPLSVA
jgi:hypothetical protein